MTPEAQKRRAGEIEYRKAHAFEDPELFPAGERCVNFGLPRLQAGYNSYLQIVQAPGYVMIMNEMAHDARIIPLDGRPHLDSSLRTWNGDSRGHWEGDTLVIDTTNFSTRSDFMGSHENLHLTERITRDAYAKKPRRSSMRRVLLPASFTYDSWTSDVVSSSVDWPSR